MSMFRSAAEISSSDSESSSDESDRGVVAKREDVENKSRSPPRIAKQPSLPAGEDAAANISESDIKELLDADTESHSNLMTAALLEFYCLTRAADLLNRQHGSHKRYTRDSPEAQFLGRKMYAYKSQFLSSHGVLPEGIDKAEWGSTRQYYRDNLDALGLSALEALNLGDNHGNVPSIGAAGDLVLASKASTNVHAHSTKEIVGNLRLETGGVGPLDVRRGPGGEGPLRAFEDFRLDPRSLPPPPLPLTGSSPVSFPLFDIDATPPSRRMSRYEVEFSEVRIIGRGSFGEVYHVKNHIDGQDYAVKKIPLSQKRLEQLQCGNQNQLESIMKEIRTLARLEHANVVRYYGAWVEQTHFPHFSLASQKTPVKLEYEHTEDDDREQSPGEESFGIVFEHSEADRHPPSTGATEDESTHSHSDRGGAVASNAYKKTLSASLEDDVESIPRKFSEPSYSQMSTFGATDDDIFTDGLSHDQSKLQIQRRHRNGTAIPAVILHIQMSLHPISLSSYLNPLHNDNDDLRRHCYHLIPSLRLMLNIIAGVDYVHSKGIVHRDLKPANIFLSHVEDRAVDECLPCKARTGTCPKFCHPRIGDFGLVADISHWNDCSPATPSPSTPIGPKISRVVGTEFYCPPFFRDDLAPPTDHAPSGEELPSYTIDESLDVYALGVILFELLYRLNTKMERQMVLTELTRGVQRPPNTDTHTRTHLNSPSGSAQEAERERPVFPPDFERKVDRGGVILRNTGMSVAESLKTVITGMLELRPQRRWRCPDVRRFLQEMLDDMDLSMS